jgi:hypothetical protein
MNRRFSHPRALCRAGQLAACVAVCIILCTASASTGEPIELHTDRDAFTPSTFCVDPGTALWEMSHVYIENRQGLPTNNYPELLCRIGRSERFEWRLGVNYSVGSQGNVVTSVEAGELPVFGNTLYESNFLYGFKLKTSQQDGLIPESSFIMEATTPMYGEEFGTEPVATTVFGWEFPAGWRCDAAMRYAYAESDTAFSATTWNSASASAGASPATPPTSSPTPAWRSGTDIRAASHERRQALDGSFVFEDDRCFSVM